MRSPALVFSLMAVSALSPTFVAASPLPATEPPALVERHRLASSHPIAPRGLGFLNEVFARTEPDQVPKAAPTSKPKVATIAGYSIGGKRQLWARDSDSSNKNSREHRRPKSHQNTNHPDSEAGIPLRKRLDDSQTAGGNAHSGTSGAVDGGSVDSGDNGGLPTIANVNSNNAGDGGGSTAGCAVGGKGATGGNASSGDSGTATGGRVRGSGGAVNVDSNNAGDAGESSSGCAEAGYSAGAGENSQGATTAT